MMKKNAKMEALMDAEQRKMPGFPIKRQLTRLVDMDGWMIYRDPQNGLYALNPTIVEYGLEINLNYWNLTLDDPKLDRAIRDIRDQISEAIENEKRFDEDEDITVREGWERA